MDVLEKTPDHASLSITASKTHKMTWIINMHGNNSFKIKQMNQMSCDGWSATMECKTHGKQSPNIQPVTEQEVGTTEKRFSSQIVEQKSENEGNSNNKSPKSNVMYKIHTRNSFNDAIH